MADERLSTGRVRRTAQVGRALAGAGVKGAGASTPRLPSAWSGRWASCAAAP